MILFLIWTGILFLGITAFFVYHMKRDRQGFRFQTRVTILFLLLTLIPTVPFIMLSIELINQGIDLLGSKNIEEIFDGSIEAIRLQLIERNNVMLDQLESLLNSGTAAEWAGKSGLSYAFRVHTDALNINVDTLFADPEVDFVSAVIDRDLYETVLSGEVNNILDKEKHIFENYRVTVDSTVLIIGMPVDPEIVKTVRSNEQAITAFGLIYLFFIEGKLGYIAAIVLVFLLTVTAMTVAWRLSKGITGPIKDLVFGFKKVGEGNVDVTINTHAKDEIEFLLRSFNAMVADLKHTRQKLLQSERIAVWRDVARQISHEIKNPLTPIQLSLHRMRKKITVPDEHIAAVEESFRTIEEEIESLRSIAAEFSEFARLPKPKLVKVYMNDIVKSTAALFEKNKKNVPVILDLSEKVPESFFDPEQLKRVFINVITNSIDATPENGAAITITSRYNSDNAAIIVRISDNGSGMSGETLKRMFDPYFTMKKEGTGLGMPIIKRIVEEHSGEIEVDSAPEKGTVVTITFKIHCIGAE